MSKINVEEELNELIFRFKRLKKALSEEETLSPAQRAAVEFARSLDSIPSRQTVLKKAAEAVEQKQAQQLANQMVAQGMLNKRLQPSREDIEMWARSGGIQTEEALQKQEANWGNSINNWISEATKPISSRFKSEEEELAYWSKIQVSDNGSGNGGY